MMIYKVIIFLSAQNLQKKSRILAVTYIKYKFRDTRKCENH